ncbi:MAG: AsmA family protein [Woeseiaceae bacterium]|nr:AsmA family protein [Woeseiaceae bacterium]
MGGLLRKLLYLLIGVAALFVVAAIAISLFFDPNDYRDRIAEEVRLSTGRELVIEGDLGLSLFPTFGIDIGRTALGNAPGFGAEPFLSFEEARLSVEVLPLVRGQGLKIGAVVLDSFELNLAVDANGRNNWQDMAEHAGAEQEPEPDVPADEIVGADASQDVELSVASIDISNAAVRYVDALAGESYSLTDFNLATGRIGGGDPIDIRSDFNFELQPADLAGDFSIETALVPVDDGVMLSDAKISAVGLDAVVSGLDQGKDFHVQVEAFSLKTLMTRLNIEAPVTADPDALGKVIFDSDLRIDDGAIVLQGVELVVDDTTFTGSMAVARDAAGTISIDLVADEIDLDRYMTPAGDAGSAGGDSVPVEIPVELIRALNVRGALSIGRADLSGMQFANVELGLNAADGKLRMHPIAADLFDGRYAGDVRIDASGDVPSLAVNETIEGVSLGALALAMFDQEDVTGTINGTFRLGGSGRDLAAIQQDLDGSITMELVDGAWEGTDVWYELRRARALFRQEEAPEPTLPARTQFSNVRATGPVADGVFRNDDFAAELPFMRLTGEGRVDFAAGDVDYGLVAKILSKPELAGALSPEELDDLTEAEIPLRITGPLTDPSIAPDLEKMLKDEVKKKVEEELKERLLDKLLGGDD